MNFIAHLYLSDNNKEILVGNFLADAIKGKQIETLPFEIQNGVRLHRQIDFFTDNHPIVKHSKQFLVEKYNHFSGVLIDIFYDYFLIKNWHKFNNISLEIFSEISIEILDKNSHILPFDSAHFLAYIKKYKIIENYGAIDTIKQVLEGMSKRTTILNSGIENGYLDLEKFENELESDFLTFFPELVASCQKFKVENQI